jgi:hypothetical protein
MASKILGTTTDSDYGAGETLGTTTKVLTTGLAKPAGLPQTF